MSHWISLVTPHGRINAWEGEPDDKPNGGVVVVHDVLGVNAQMQRIAMAYADAGYLTLVPALFDPIQREIELDDTPENRRTGMALAQRLGMDLACGIISAAADAIAHAGKIALVGYGWGLTAAARVADELDLPCIHFPGADYNTDRSDEESPTIARTAQSGDSSATQALHSRPQTLFKHEPAAASEVSVPEQADMISPSLQHALAFFHTQIRHEND